MLKALFSIIMYPLAGSVFLISAGIYFTASLLVPARYLSPLVRVLAHSIIFSSGHILRVKGPRPDPSRQPYMYLFNHESLFDVFMLAAAIPHYVTSVGAQKQFSWPVWGWLVKRYGIIPIRRRVLNEAIHSLERLEDYIRQGVSCLISPEGTRTLTGEMGPFKKGPFHLALNTGVTLVPVGLIGAFHAKRKTDWRITPGFLTIYFGDPILKSSYDTLSVEELRDMVKVLVANLIQDAPTLENHP